MNNSQRGTYQCIRVSVGVKSASKSTVKCMGSHFLHFLVHFVATLNRIHLIELLKR